MTTYLWIKLLHIISAAVLFGTGMGTAFFMLRAYLSHNDAAMLVTTRNVVIADGLFTSPAIVVQLLTGLWLTGRLGIAMSSVWFIHRYEPVRFCRYLLASRRYGYKSVFEISLQREKGATVIAS